MEIFQTGNLQIIILFNPEEKFELIMANEEYWKLVLKIEQHEAIKETIIKEFTNEEEKTKYIENLLHYMKQLEEKLDTVEYQIYKIEDLIRNLTWQHWLTDKQYREVEKAIEKFKKRIPSNYHSKTYSS